MCSALSSLQASVGNKKLNSVTLNLKDKVQRGDGWHNRRKGSSIQLCPPCTCYTSKTSRPVPPGLESLLFLWSLVAALLIRQATVKRVSRWMDSRSVPNAECAATGGQAKVKTRIAVHQRLPRLKQRAAPHAMHIKDPTLRNKVFFLKMVSMNSSTLFLV